MWYAGYSNLEESATHVSRKRGLLNKFCNCRGSLHLIHHSHGLACLVLVYVMTKIIMFS